MLPRTPLTLSDEMRLWVFKRSNLRIQVKLILMHRWANVSIRTYYTHNIYSVQCSAMHVRRVLLLLTCPYRGCFGGRRGLCSVRIASMVRNSPMPCQKITTCESGSTAT